MLYSLYYLFGDVISWFNIFRYITFRSLLGAFISFLIVIVFGHKFIEFVKRKKYDVLRKNTPERHKQKLGTPSMGGVMIFVAVVIAILITGRTNEYIVLSMIVFLLFSAVGLWDDYTKMSKNKGRGISTKTKIISKMLIAMGIGFYFVIFKENSFYLTGSTTEELLSYSHLTLPFLPEFSIDLKWLYIPFVMCFLFCTSTSVNLTDGLDGLAISLSLIVFSAFAVILYFSGHSELAKYLKIPYILNIGELTVFASALIGASLGFLWFNAYPAQIFMGDTGSLGLGGIMGFLAIVLKIEFLFIIIGFAFVIEAFSSGFQIYYYKLTKKRFFKMAPLHHHFEMKGMAENKIIVRFIIFGIICAMLGLLSLKIR